MNVNSAIIMVILVTVIFVCAFQMIGNLIVPLIRNWGIIMVLLLIFYVQLKQIQFQLEEKKSKEEIKQ